MAYPKVYHDATAYLVRFGAHGPNRNEARRMIARALKTLRNLFGHERARSERRGMIFISGMMPAKVL